MDLSKNAIKNVKNASREELEKAVTDLFNLFYMSEDGFDYNQEVDGGDCVMLVSDILERVVWSKESLVMQEVTATLEQENSILDPKDAPALARYLCEKFDINSKDKPIGTDEPATIDWRPTVWPGASE